MTRSPCSAQCRSPSLPQARSCGRILASLQDQFALPHHAVQNHPDQQAACCANTVALYATCQGPAPRKNTHFQAHIHRRNCRSSERCKSARPGRPDILAIRSSMIAPSGSATRSASTEKKMLRRTGSPSRSNMRYPWIGNSLLHTAAQGRRDCGVSAIATSGAYPAGRAALEKEPRE